MSLPYVKGIFSHTREFFYLELKVIRIYCFQACIFMMNFFGRHLVSVIKYLVRQICYLSLGIEYFFEYPEYPEYPFPNTQLKTTCRWS